MKSTYKGISRIIHAFKYSFDGIISVFKSEAAFRQDILLCLFLTILLFFIKVGLFYKFLMFLSLIFIIISELFNTAIETIIDRISAKKHPLSKKAKDIGSATVMLTITSVAIFWFIIILFTHK